MKYLTKLMERFSKKPQTTTAPPETPAAQASAVDVDKAPSIDGD